MDHSQHVCSPECFGIGRRRFLQGASALAAVSVAGCSGDLASPMVANTALPEIKRSFLLTNGFVMPMNSERTYFPNGAIAVVDGEIRAVGESDVLKPKYPQLPEINAQGHLVLPGFIDTHIHDWYALRHDSSLPDFNQPHRHSSFSRGGDFQGLAQFGDLLLSVQDRILGDDERHAAALLMTLDLIKSGTTCGIDAGSGSAGPLAQAFVDIGMRGAVTELAGDVIPLANGGFERNQDADELAARMEKTISDWHGKHNRVRVLSGVLYNVFGSDELIGNMQALSQRHGIKLSTHMAALSNEDRMSVATFGRPVYERLESLGVVGPNLLACHMGFIEDELIPKVAASGAGCNYAPVGSGTIGVRYPIDNVHPRLWGMGGKVAVATDGGQAQPATMLGAARAAYLQHNIAANQEGVITPYKALELATIDSARVAGWDNEIGSLEPGKRADIVLHDVSDDRYDGLGDPVFTFFMRGERADVRTVIVDGEVILHNGTATRVDETLLRRNARSAIRAVGLRVDAVRTAVEVFS
ncbi:MAG: amidohydrolase family protein [Pseudomonadota bacterium]